MMDDQEPQFLDVGEGGKRRRIAYRYTDKSAGGDLALVWMSGFLSDMGSTKAHVMADFARARGLPMLRFDYSGHGLSSGSLLEASIGDWLSQPTEDGGRGFGTTATSVLFLTIIAALVLFLTVTKRDRTQVATVPT